MKREKAKRKETRIVEGKTGEDKKEQGWSRRNEKGLREKRFQVKGRSAETKGRAAERRDRE